ncbi:MAG: DUF2059 domain-containing protein [Candidatus Angelobacter sp.]
MRCKGLVVLVLLAVAAPVFAQQSVAEAAAQAKSKREVFPADAPTHDQVMTLLDLLQVRRNMVLMIDGMKNAMKEGAERGFRERVPNPTPKQVEALRGMIDGALSEMPLDEMVEATVAVYRRHLTKSDVEEMIRFYAGPVGQKVLQEQPKMLQESMQAGTEIQKKRMDQIIAKIRESEQKMLEADEETNTTPKK